MSKGLEELALLAQAPLLLILALLPETPVLLILDPLSNLQTYIY